MKSKICLLALAFAPAGCNEAPTGIDDVAQYQHASHVGEFVRPSRPDSIFNRYIVVFKPGISSANAMSEALTRIHGGVRFAVYEHALKGFAVANLPAPAVEALRRNPTVAFVEEDRPQPQGYVQDVSQDGYLWGLDRVDERERWLDGAFNYFFPGDGVHIYI